MSRYQGRLQVYVAEGRNLPNHDFFGKQDPFLEFHVGSRVHRTQVHKKGGVNPVWKEDVCMDIPFGVRSMTLRCIDQDIGSNDSIGRCAIDLVPVMERGSQHGWFKLHQHGRFAGEVYLELTFTSALRLQRLTSWLERLARWISAVAHTPRQLGQGRPSSYPYAHSATASTSGINSSSYPSHSTSYYPSGSNSPYPSYATPSMNDYSTPPGSYGQPGFIGGFVRPPPPFAGMDPPYGQEPPPPFGGPQRASSLYSAFPPSYSHDPYTHSGSAANRYPHDGGMFGAAPPLMGSATYHPLATGGYPPFGGQGSPPPPYAAEGDGFDPTGFGFPPR